MEETSKMASIKEVMAYFGMTPKEMKAEWRKLSEEDKRQIREEIGNGSETY